MKLNTIKTYHTNGNLHEMYTINIHNQKHGTYQSWYDNGQLGVQSEYLNGKLHGIYQEWYSNGQLMLQSEYLNGKRHGIRYTWNKNGSLKYIQQFDTDNILVHVNYENNPILIEIHDEANVESTTLLTHLISQLTSEGKNYEIKHR